MKKRRKHRRRAYSQKYFFHIIHYLFVLFSLLIGIYLRAVNLEKVPIVWMDEVELGHQSLQFRERVINSGIVNTLFFHPFILEGYKGWFPYLFSLLFPSHLLRDVLAYRFISFSFGVLTLIAVYFLGVEIGGKHLGAFALLVTSLLPSHVWLSRIFPAFSILAFFSTLSFLLLFKYVSTKKYYFLVLLSISWGLSVLTRLSFLFVIVSILFILLKLKLSLKELTVLFLPFLFLISPFLIYNLQSNFQVLSTLRNFPYTYTGVNLLDMKSNLIRGILGNLPKFLTGKFEIYHIQPFTPILYIFPITFILTLLSYRIVSKSVISYFLLSFSVTIFLTSTLTLSQFVSYEFALVLPHIIFFLVIPFYLIDKYIPFPISSAFLTFLLISNIPSFYESFYKSQKYCVEVLKEEIITRIKSFQNVSFVVGEPLVIRGLEFFDEYLAKKKTLIQPFKTEDFPKISQLNYTIFILPKICVMDKALKPSFVEMFNSYKQQHGLKEVYMDDIKIDNETMFKLIMLGHERM